MSQRMTALAEANRRRLLKAQLKRDIRDRPELLVEVVLNQPGFLVNATVGELVRALPRFGPGRTNRLLASCELSPSKSFGSLTVRQRGVLAAALSDVFSPQEVAA